MTRAAEIRVRRAEAGDAEALTAIAAAVGGEEERWLLATAEWRPVAQERRYLRAVRSSPNAAVFVAEAPDGELVGRLSLARDAHPASAHVADLGIMIAAGRRRQGIGRLMLAHAVAWARGAGVSKLELHVVPWNEPAIKLYEAFGFEREGFRKAHYVRDGEYVDAVLMAYRVK